MEVHQKHGKVTKNMHGASRNNRYVWDVSLLIMDPWSKVDYSRLIREASMAMEKLPKVDPPFGRVPGQGLLVAPILKQRRRRNREGISKKASSPRVFRAKEIYRQRGAARGATKGPG